MFLLNSVQLFAASAPYIALRIERFNKKGTRCKEVVFELYKRLYESSNEMRKVGAHIEAELTQQKNIRQALRS